MKVVVKRKGDERRIGGEKKHKWNIKEGNMLEVQWTKESRSMTMLSEGVSNPWASTILVLKVSTNKQNFCITHHSIISS
jgi:hypothetical protein